MRNLLSEISVFSETELPSLSFTESYFNKKSKKWYIVAYFNKREVAKIYLTEIQAGIKNIEIKLKGIRCQSSCFLQFIKLSKILKELIPLLNTVEKLTVLDFENGNEMYSKIFAFKDECDERSQILKEEMRFSIDIRNDFDDFEFDDVIPNAIKEILEKEGFVCDSEGDMYIIGEIETHITENRVGVFVTPRLSIKIIDAENDKVVASYSKVYEKWGHINLEGAMDKALFEVSQDLALHFMEIFR